MEILLTSKFEQKDEVKALGAKWSAAAKRWFVDAGETIESIESAKSKFLKFIDAKELSGVNFVIGTLERRGLNTIVKIEQNQDAVELTLKNGKHITLTNLKTATRVKYVTGGQRVETNNYLVLIKAIGGIVDCLFENSIKFEFNGTLYELPCNHV